MTDNEGTEQVNQTTSDVQATDTQAEQPQPDNGATWEASRDAVWGRLDALEKAKLNMPASDETKETDTPDPEQEATPAQDVSRARVPDYSERTPIRHHPLFKRIGG